VTSMIHGRAVDNRPAVGMAPHPIDIAVALRTFTEKNFGSPPVPSCPV
jgi:hypothetical protein